MSFTFARAFKFLRSYWQSFGVVVFSVLLPILSSVLITSVLLLYEQELRLWDWHYWLLLYILTGVLMGCALMPTTLMAVLTGYFLSWQGTPLMILAYLLAAYIGYDLGRRLSGSNFHKNILKKPKVQQFLQLLNQKSWRLIILVRLSPVLAFALVNFILATTKMPIRIFLLGSLIGMLPRTLLSIWIGTRVESLKVFFSEGSSSPFPYSEVLVIILSVITIFGISKLIQNTLKELKYQ